ncbi:MAG: histidine phosphatase family protein [bacterium]
MLLYLLRHGESAANAAGIIQGQQDFPLSDLGRSQAATAGRFLAQLPDLPQAILASPLTRAADTARIIKAILPEGLPLTFHPALKEMFAGSIEGMTWEAIREEHPAFYGRPLEDWLNYTQWGGHSREEFFGIVHTWLDASLLEWKAREIERVLIVTHAVTLRALIAGLIGQRQHHQMEYHFGNCTLVRVRVRPADQGERTVLDALVPIEVQASVVGNRSVQ